MGEWSTWNDCPVTCAGSNQARVRTCENGSFGQEGCRGAQTDLKPCNTNTCRKYNRFCTNKVLRSE